MARKSLQSATVATFVKKAPPPPSELTSAQAEIWRDVTAVHGADWIRKDAFPLLANYCRHVETARMLGAEIDRFEAKWLRDDEGMARFKALSTLRERETRALTALARSLRISHQSRYTPHGAASAAKSSGGPKPWEDEEGR